jgi:hypothetical protein
VRLTEIGRPRFGSLVVRSCLWKGRNNSTGVSHADTINSVGDVVSAMMVEVDSGLVSLFGSRTRLLTMAVIANADEPLTGYRVAKIADLPRIKVYPEIRKGVVTNLLVRDGRGYRMIDSDVRALLRKRVRIRWDEEWDRSRKGWNDETSGRLARALASIPTEPNYLRPRGWKPSPSVRKAIREMERPAAKDALLRRRGLRTSARGDWPREH